jgi:hypothetical protein
MEYFRGSRPTLVKSQIDIAGIRPPPDLVRGTTDEGRGQPWKKYERDRQKPIVQWKYSEESAPVKLLEVAGFPPGIIQNTSDQEP